MENIRIVKTDLFCSCLCNFVRICWNYSVSTSNVPSRTLTMESVKPPQVHSCVSLSLQLHRFNRILLPSTLSCCKTTTSRLFAWQILTFVKQVLWICFNCMSFIYTVYYTVYVIVDCKRTDRYHSADSFFARNCGIREETTP